MVTSAIGFPLILFLPSLFVLVLGDAARPIMCVSDFEGQGETKHLRHGQQPEGPAGIHGQPTLHPFWAAGFSFARGHFVIQIPYDQYLPMVFQGRHGCVCDRREVHPPLKFVLSLFLAVLFLKGEEISIGLRAFTHGYDFYAGTCLSGEYVSCLLEGAKNLSLVGLIAERGVCFHMYAIKENADRRKKIPLFWENGRLYKKASAPAMKRLNTLIGMADWPTSEWPQQERDLYTLGKVRETSKFFKTFGIHVKEQTVEHHLCRFVGKPMMKVGQTTFGASV